MSVEAPEHNSYGSAELFDDETDLNRAIHYVRLSQTIESYVDELEVTLPKRQFKPGKEFEETCQSIFKSYWNYRNSDQFLPSDQHRAERLINLYGQLGSESPASAELLEIKRAQVLFMAEEAVREPDVESKRVMGNFVALLAGSIGFEIVLNPKAVNNQKIADSAVPVEPLLKTVKLDRRSALRVNKISPDPTKGTMQRWLRGASAITAATAALTFPLSGLLTSGAAAAEPESVHSESSIVNTYNPQRISSSVIESSAVTPTADIAEVATGISSSTQNLESAQSVIPSSTDLSSVATSSEGETSLESAEPETETDTIDEVISEDSEPVYQSASEALAEQEPLTDLAAADDGAEVASPEEAEAEQKPKHRNNGHKNGNHGHESGHGSKHNGGGNHQKIEALNPDQVSHRAIEKMKQMGPMWHNRAIMLEVLLNNGWKPHQAVGAIGSACVEAGGCELDPKVDQIGYSGPDEGMGVIQWTKNSRWQGLLGFAKSHNLNPFSVFAQAKFIHFEMMHGESGAWGEMQGTGGPNEAAYAFSKYYERPADVSASIGLRQQYARQTLEMYNKQKHEIRHDHQQKLREQRRHERREERREERQEQRRYFQFATGEQIKNHLMSKYDGDSGKLGPHELEIIGKTWGHSKLYPSAARSFRAMSDAFKNEFGRPLMLSGGPGSDDAYRSYAAQKRLKDQKPYLAAPVGTSNHGWGLAVDLGGGVNVLGTPEHNWMVRHASRFGWGQEEFAKPGGSKPEEWHWTLFNVVKNLPETHEQNNHKHNQSKNKHDHNQSHKENHPGSKFPISKHGFTTPLDPKFHVTTPYDGYHNISGVHTGADYAAPIGTPTRATNDGVVVKVWHNDPVVGNSVNIYHPDANMTSNYQHMDSTKLHEGEHVNLGEYIGRTGNKGNSTGPHLHYMLMRGRQTGITSHSESNVYAETDPPGEYLPNQHDIQKFYNRPKDNHNDHHNNPEPKQHKQHDKPPQPIEIKEEEIISVSNEAFASQSVEGPEKPVGGPVASDRPTEDDSDEALVASTAQGDWANLDDKEMQSMFDSILAESN